MESADLTAGASRVWVTRDNGERLVSGHQVTGVKEQELNRTGRHRISPLGEDSPPEKALPHLNSPTHHISMAATLL